jgi:2-octaprenyl-6-methoxyphenol hydroxylase
VGCSEDEFRERLQRAFGYWLGRVTLAKPRQAFPLKLVRADTMRGDRVLLIGNAMHQLHPVAGQGFNLGLRDVALLAEMLVAQQGFGDDIGESGFLDRYTRARRDDLNAVIRFTDGLVGVFSNDFPPLIATRNLGLLVLDHCAPLKHFLVRQAMGLGRRLPRFA